MLGLCGNYFSRYGFPHVGISRRDLLYPCPALVFCNGSSYVSRAAAPEGTGGDEVL